MTIEETINRMNTTDSLSELCDMVLQARELIEKEYQKNKSRIFQMLNMGKNNDFFNFDAPMVKGDANAKQNTSNALNDVGQQTNVLEGDAISRQAVQDYIAKYLSQYLYDDVRGAVEVIDEYIAELPPVNPQPKTGHWFLLDECSNSG